MSEIKQRADKMRSQATARRAPRTDWVPKLRVKNEPPTMEEAMLAASCISDEPAQQLEIAASLLGLKLDAETQKALSAAKPRGNVVDISTRGGGARTVVVEKKRTIRPPSRPAAVTPRAFSGQLRLGGRI